MTSRTCDAMCENIEELVLGAAVVEDITCGVGDARNVIRGEYVNGICQHDIDVIGGLVNAYELMFENFDKPVSLDAAARYNWCVEQRFDDRTGNLRVESVYISGCEYEPPPTLPADSMNRIAPSSRYCIVRSVSSSATGTRGRRRSLRITYWYMTMLVA